MGPGNFPSPQNLAGLIRFFRIPAFLGTFLGNLT